MMKTLATIFGSYPKLALTATSGNVTIGEQYLGFVFGAETTFNTVLLQKESSYDDVLFSINMRIKDIESTSTVGITISGAADSVNAELITFVVRDSAVDYYINGALISTTPTNVTLEERIYNLTLRRTDNTYYFLLDDSLIVSDTRLNFKQNTDLGIVGSNIHARMLTVSYITGRPIIEFGILGDSISNNSYLPVVESVKGKLQALGLTSVGEFSGDANIVKDTLDSIDEVLDVTTDYCIVMYGHNDTLFNTGDLIDNLEDLKTILLDNNITPIFCTIPFSTDIDYQATNTLIRNAFFGTDLHIDLEDCINLSDTTDGVHPNSTGTQKIADLLYAQIQIIT